MGNISGVVTKIIPKGLNEAVVVVISVDLVAGDEVLLSMLFAVICKNVERGMRGEIGEVVRLVGRERVKAIELYVRVPPTTRWSKRTTILLVDQASAHALVKTRKCLGPVETPYAGMLHEKRTTLLPIIPITYDKEGSRD